MSLLALSMTSIENDKGFLSYLEIKKAFRAESTAAFDPDHLTAVCNSPQIEPIKLPKILAWF